MTGYALEMVDGAVDDKLCLGNGGAVDDRLCLGNGRAMDDRLCLGNGGAVDDKLCLGERTEGMIKKDSTIYFFRLPVSLARNVYTYTVRNVTYIPA